MSDPETARDPDVGSAGWSGSGTVDESGGASDQAAVNDAQNFTGSRTYYDAEMVTGARAVNGARTTYDSGASSGPQTAYGAPPLKAAADGAEDELDGALWPYEDENFPDEFESGTDIPATRLVSLGAIGAAIRRRRLTYYLLAAVGLLLGSALFITGKPTYQVTITVLLTSNPGLDPISQMDTYGLQAQSPELGTIMVKKFGLDESALDFVNSYTVTVVNNQILTIAYSNKSADIATSRAVSLADEFLQFRAASLRDEQNAVFAAQNQQVAQEEQTVDALTKQVSAAASGSTSKADLKTQLAKATSALASLETTVSGSQAQQRVLTTSMVSGSDVLSVSYPALLHSRKTAALEYVGGGAIGGLVLGMAIVAIGAIVSDRPRRRSEIAEALGAPVRVSVTAGAVGGGRRGRKQATWSAAETKRVIGYLRSTLPDKSRDAATLAVVAVDNTAETASIVTALIGSCAAEGKRVFVADLTGGVLAGQLGITTPGVHTVTVDQERIVLAVPDPGDIAPAGPLSRQAALETAGNGIASAYAGADIMIVLAALDPAIGAGHLSTWAGEAVAVLTAGASTTEKVYAMGEMIRDVGIHLESGVLLGADKNDQSLGVVS